MGRLGGEGAGWDYPGGGMDWVMGGEGVIYFLLDVFSICFIFIIVECSNVEV